MKVVGVFYKEQSSFYLHDKNIIRQNTTVFIIWCMFLFYFTLRWETKIERLRKQCLKVEKSVNCSNFLLYQFLILLWIQTIFTVNM